MVDRPDKSLSLALQIAARVQSAARLRQLLFGPFLHETETNAYRMVHGAGDGLEGFHVDAYSGFLVVAVLTKAALRSAPLLEAAIAEALRPRGIVRKLRYEEKGRGHVLDEVAWGEKPPAEVTVLENGIPFCVELMGGLHTGLFMDMREEHARLRRLAAGRRVLNTFAYTGAFSVAAALGGASAVTSVDVVPKVLERAKKNFLLAGIDPEAHRFARMDVLEYLRMAERRGWLFDAIVLDPPTFASFKSGSWSLKSGYGQLLERALAVLERDGLLWIAANTESLPAERFEKTVAAALGASGRSARTLAVSGLPPDYPTPPSSPEARYLKVHVVEVTS